MTRKDYWGIAALIVILIAAGGFIYYQWSSVQQLKEQLAQDEKRFEEKDKPVAENDLPPAPAGYKWVQHGDHHHLAPIDSPDEWQGKPHESIVNPLEEARLQKQAEIRAEEEAYNKAYAAAKTAREKNQIRMSRMEGDPLRIDMYNFLKEHPDFDLATASPEVEAKWIAAVRAGSAKRKARAAEVDAWFKNNNVIMKDQAPKNPEPIIIRPNPPHQEGGDE